MVLECANQTLEDQSAKYLQEVRGKRSLRLVADFSHHVYDRVNVGILKESV
jgi:hypothetical protein